MATPTAPRAKQEAAKRHEDGAQAAESGASEQQVKEAESLDAKTTYEVIRREGKKELERSSDALFFARLAVVEPETQRALSDLATEAMKFSFPVTLLHAV